MIDLHTHVLPGIDDGAATLEASVALGRAAVADGVTAIAATPHVRDDYPTDAATMEGAVARVRAAFAEAALPLRVLTGGEIALERVRGADVAELRAFGLGGNPSYLLVEFPYTGWPLDLPDLLFGLLAQGVTPVLAHPERNDVVQGAPRRLEALTASGCLVQVTAASAVGALGRRPRAAAAQLLELGLVHLLATDAHSAASRGGGLAAAAAAVGGGSLADWLTRAMPAAIVADAPLPARPEVPRARPWGRKARPVPVDVAQRTQPPPPVRAPSSRYLVFSWSATGYALREVEGEPPPAGSTIEVGERVLRVSRVGPSPLPGDRRPCAYTELP